MTYFIDADISIRFAEALRVFHVDVDHLFHRFKANARDSIWLPEICKEGRIIISCDKSQTKYKGKTAIELGILKRRRGRAFYLEAGFSQWGIWKQASCFFRCWETIDQIAPSMKPGDIYYLSESGKPTQKHFRKP